MPEAYPIQTNFTAGEVSPYIRGRVDITKYFNGVEKLQNFLVKPQGGISRRSGTRFVEETKDSSKTSILVRFEFSATQAFVLEFGDQYIRFIKDGAQILDGGIPVEVVTPYLEAHLKDLSFTQSADVVYITHPLYKPKTLSRYSDINWVLEDYVTKDGPYLDVDIRGITMTLTSIVNRATLKSTVSEFVVGDVGKYVEYPYKTKLVVGKIITYVSGTEVVIEPYENIIDVAGLDNQAVLTYQAGAGGGYQLLINNGGSWTVPASTTLVSNVLTFNESPNTGWMNLPVGFTSVSNPTSYTNRIRSTLSIWTLSSENAFIRVDGVWYKTGKHIGEPENYTAPIGGGTVSADVIEVSSILTMKSTTGILSFSNHNITAQLNSSDNVFASTDVGRQFRLEFSSEQVWGTVATYNDAKTVQVSLGRMMPPAKERLDSYLDNAKTLNWRFGAWFTNNYPQCSTFHEERLWFGGSPLQPQTVWSSKSSDYNNFAPTNQDSSVADDSAITYTISSSRINSIVWMMSSSVLIIGTIGSEWQTKASTINQPITPTNLAVVEQTSYGSAKNLRPTKVGSSVFFIQRSSHKLRELFYEFQTDAYKASDLTVISEHILRQNGGAVSTAYQKEPSSIFWISTGKGQLAAFTYEKDQEVFAWHNHIIGGIFNGGNAVVESVTSVPGGVGSIDQVYIIVKRTINGQTKRYIEYLEEEFLSLEVQDKDNMFFVDSGLTYNGSPVNTVSGLDHLEGQLVQVVADGSIRDNLSLVVGGEVTISGAAASVIHAGLPYRSLLKTLPIEAGSESGTAQGKMKRLHKVNLRILSSLGLKYGPSEDKLSFLSFRKTTSEMDMSPDLFTGDKSFDMPSDYDTDGSYYIVQDQPYPLNILSLMPQLQTTK